MNELTEEIHKLLRAQVKSDQIAFPPPFTKITQGSFLEYIPGKSVKMSFPIKEEYNNPFGITFGGFLGMFFDHAFGPFSGLTAGKPTTSLDLNITFLKPLSPADKVVIVDAEIVSQSKSYLTMYAKATSGRGVLVGTATSRMLILNR